MKKSVKFSLNKYPSIPDSLQSPPGSGVLASELEVDCARLFHHYYMDTRGCCPPNPDPAQFEHLTLLLPCTELRVIGDGFGVSTAFRKHRSNELGQAFCRWFLYEHIGITYFAHMEHVLNRGANSKFGGLKVERIEEGDTPDYFCSQSISSVYLAEAKGRITSVSFSSEEFKKWRKQFDRVAVKDNKGITRSVKGHIVATRFATEENRSSVKSTLYAEDPASPGETLLEESNGLGSAIIALHYSVITEKIRQPLLSLALRTGIPVPEDIFFPAVVWKFRTEPLAGKRFVGGYFPGPLGTLPVNMKDGKAYFLSDDPLRLDVTSGTFFGIEENIFKIICTMGRRGDIGAFQMQQLPEIPPFYSAISLLRDGTIIGPIEFFEPIGGVVY